MSDGLGLYLHIPFCESICNYCNFNRGLLDEQVKPRYLHALAREVRDAGDGTEVDTIFFGGGTPSVLDAEEVAAILEACRAAFAVRSDAEVTLEVNPETATPDRLEGWREVGVTRLSIGTQSLRDDELARLGRRHSAAGARRAVRAARAAGHDNVSVDLMLWLPDQTRAHARESVEGLVDLGPDHASLYLLELYPNAPLREEMARGGWAQAGDEVAAEMYLDALDILERAGFRQYEISNVARPGRACRHNVKYWSGGAWLGFGCGAHSTRRGRRWANVSETSAYIRRVESGGSPAQDAHHLTAAEQLSERLFMGLRRTEGVDLAEVERDHGVSVLERYGAALEPHQRAGLVRIQDGRIRLSRSGMLLANEVMGTFV